MANQFWTSETSPVLLAVDAGRSPVLVSGIGAPSRAHVAAAMRKEMESHLDALGAYEDGEDVEKIIADAFEAGDEMETHNAWLDYGDCNAAFDIFPCNII